MWPQLKFFFFFTCGSVAKVIWSESFGLFGHVCLSFHNASVSHLTSIPKISQFTCIHFIMIFPLWSVSQFYITWILCVVCVNCSVQCIYSPIIDNYIYYFRIIHEGTEPCCGSNISALKWGSNISALHRGSNISALHQGSIISVLHRWSYISVLHRGSYCRNWLNFQCGCRYWSLKRWSPGVLSDHGTNLGKIQ